jgi:Uma2 family endonuclease
MNAVFEKRVSTPFYRLSLRQYHTILALGVIPEDERVELLEGILAKKMTKSPEHEYMVAKLHELLAPLIGEQWIMRTQSAITLRGSEPEPDLVVAAGPLENYAHRHPRSRDIALVVEVAESSLALDRGRKHRIYARAEIPVYWIVNLVDKQVEVYTEPTAGRAPTYRKHVDLGREGALDFSGRPLFPVSSLFGS